MYRLDVCFLRTVWNLLIVPLECHRHMISSASAVPQALLFCSQPVPLVAVHPGAPAPRADHSLCPAMLHVHMYNYMQKLQLNRNE